MLEKHAVDMWLTSHNIPQAVIKHGWKMHHLDFMNDVTVPAVDIRLMEMDFSSYVHIH